MPVAMKVETTGDVCGGRAVDVSIRDHDGEPIERRAHTRCLRRFEDGRDDGATRIGNSRGGARHSVDHRKCGKHADGSRERCVISR
jgi:hypothetical protein